MTHECSYFVQISAVKVEVIPLPPATPYGINTQIDSDAISYSTNEDVTTPEPMSDIKLTFTCKRQVV